MLTSTNPQLDKPTNSHNELFRFRALKNVDYSQIDEAAARSSNLKSSHQIEDIRALLHPHIPHLVTVDMDETLFLEVHQSESEKSEYSVSMGDYFLFLLNKFALEDALRFLFIGYANLINTQNHVLLDPTSIALFNQIIGTYSSDSTNDRISATILGLTGRSPESQPETMHLLKYILPSLYRYFLQLNLNHLDVKTSSECIQSIIYCGKGKRKEEALVRHCREFDIQCAHVLSIDDRAKHCIRLANLAACYQIPTDVFHYTLYEDIKSRQANVLQGNIAPDLDSLQAAPAMTESTNRAKRQIFLKNLAIQLGHIRFVNDTMILTDPDQLICLEISLQNGKLEMTNTRGTHKELLSLVRNAISQANDFLSTNNRLNAEVENFYQTRQSSAVKRRRGKSKKDLDFHPESDQVVDFFAEDGLDEIFSDSTKSPRELLHAYVSQKGTPLSMPPTPVREQTRHTRRGSKL